MTGARLYKKYTRKTIGDRVRPYGWLVGAIAAGLLVTMPMWALMLGII